MPVLTVMERERNCQIVPVIFLHSEKLVSLRSWFVRNAGQFYIQSGARKNSFRNRIVSNLINSAFF